MAARDRRSGVVAATGEDQLWLAEIRPTTLARSIVAVLPTNEAGPGRAMSVPYSALVAVVEPVAEGGHRS